MKVEDRAVWGKEEDQQGVDRGEEEWHEEWVGGAGGERLSWCGREDGRWCGGGIGNGVGVGVWESDG